MDQVIAWAALGFSAVAAAGVSWQIWRGERRVPRWGFAMQWVGRLDEQSVFFGVRFATVGIRTMGTATLYEARPMVWGPALTNVAGVEDVAVMDVHTEPFIVSVMVRGDLVSDVWVGVIWTAPDRDSPRESAERTNMRTGELQRWEWRSRPSAATRRLLRRRSPDGHWKRTPPPTTEQREVPFPEEHARGPVLHANQFAQLLTAHEEWTREAQATRTPPPTEQ